MATTIPGSALAEWRKHWPLVAATMMGMSLAALLTSVFGVILGPIEREFGWTRAEISSGPAVVSMMGLFLAIPAGHLIDRFGARRCGLVVIACSFASMAAMSAIGNQLWQWWACWAVFGIAGSFTSTVWMAPVSTIFHSGRGMAIALTVSGTGISMTLAPGIAEWFVQHYSWRTGLLALGVMWCAAVLPLVLAFVPNHIAPVEEAEEALAPVQDRNVGLTPREGFASPTLYILFFASLLSAMTGVALILNLVPVLTFTGLTRTEAVTIAGSMGIASIVGRIVGGYLMDRYDVRRLAIGACVVSLGLPLSLLLGAGTFWAAMAGIIAYGLTGGMKMNAIVYLVSTHMGARSFGLFYGVISITTTVAMGIGPLIANHIYDVSKSYTPVIWATVPGFILAGVLFATLGPAPALKARDTP
ncbi:MAG: MFS transporter [Novosphingobium sp.]|nr:MAG: MFS transporter [Novosphingobium sp.]